MTSLSEIGNSLGCMMNESGTDAILRIAPMLTMLSQYATYGTIKRGPAFAIVTKTLHSVEQIFAMK